MIKSEAPHKNNLNAREDGSQDCSHLYVIPSPHSARRVTVAAGGFAVTRMRPFVVTSITACGTFTFTTFSCQRLGSHSSRRERLRCEGRRAGLAVDGCVRRSCRPGACGHDTRVVGIGSSSSSSATRVVGSVQGRVHAHGRSVCHPLEHLVAVSHRSTTRPGNTVRAALACSTRRAEWHGVRGCIGALLGRTHVPCKTALTVKPFPTRALESKFIRPALLAVRPT
jgi:hypothetical protein